MKSKNITIDDLAIMVKKGFDGVDKRFDQVLDYVDKRFNNVDKRFDRIEKLLIDDHRRRIEKLENQVQELRELLAVK